MAESQAPLVARHLRVSPEELQRYQQLASHMLYPNSRFRAPASVLRRNRLGQSGLWAYGISGDLPILLVTVGDQRDILVVREALLAHTYWRLRGLQDRPGDPGRGGRRLRAAAAGQLCGSLVQSHSQYTGTRPARRHLPPGRRVRCRPRIMTLLMTVARVVLVASRGRSGPAARPPRRRRSQLPSVFSNRRQAGEEPSTPLPFMELPYFNGLGGFTPDGREYAIYLGPGRATPAPWVNVMANPTFGALVSRVGRGLRLVREQPEQPAAPVVQRPGHRPVGRRHLHPGRAAGGVLDADPVAHPGAGRLPGPPRPGLHRLRAQQPRDRAGVGDLRADGRERGAARSGPAAAAAQPFVPAPDPAGDLLRRLGAGGDPRGDPDARRHRLGRGGRTAAGAQLLPPGLPGTGRLCRQQRPALQLHRRPDGVPGPEWDALAARGPAARQSLSGRVGAGLDPCAALQVIVEIDPWRETEVTFLLGEAADTAEARRLVEQFRDPDRVEEALRQTRGWWDELLGTIQVETPDLSVNFLLNRWLLYQALSCRIWARSAFYQSGRRHRLPRSAPGLPGAALHGPEISRAQILTAAAHQFGEGDVQHWWHPESGAGVRTRISDDLLWLPYAVGPVRPGDRRRRDPRRGGALPGGQGAGSRGARGLLRPGDLRRGQALSWSTAAGPSPGA